MTFWTIVSFILIHDFLYSPHAFICITTAFIRLFIDDVDETFVRELVILTNSVLGFFVDGYAIWCSFWFVDLASTIVMFGCDNMTRVIRRIQLLRGFAGLLDASLLFAATQTSINEGLFSEASWTFRINERWTSSFACWYWTPVFGFL